MKKLADVLKHYVEQHPPACGDAEAVVDWLFWAYMENCKIHNEKTKDRYAALRERVNLPFREYDEVLCIVSDLCLEHGRLAFMEGLNVWCIFLHSAKKTANT